MNSEGEASDSSGTLRMPRKKSINAQRRGEKMLKWVELFKKYNSLSESDSSSVRSPDGKVVTGYSNVEEKGQPQNASMSSEGPTAHEQDISVRCKDTENPGTMNQILQPTVHDDNENDYHYFCQQGPTSFSILPTSPRQCLDEYRSRNVACMEHNDMDIPVNNEAVSNIANASNTPKEIVERQFVKQNVCINNANELIEVKRSMSADTNSTKTPVNSASEYDNSEHQKSKERIGEVPGNNTYVYEPIRKHLNEFEQVGPDFVKTSRNTRVSYTVTSQKACMDESQSQSNFTDCEGKRTPNFHNDNQTRHKKSKRGFTKVTITKRIIFKLTEETMPVNNPSAISKSPNECVNFNFMNPNTLDGNNKNTPNFQGEDDSINSIHTESNLSPKTNETSSEVCHIGHRLYHGSTNIETHVKKKCVLSKITSKATGVHEDNFYQTCYETMQYKNKKNNTSGGNHGGYININKNQCGTDEEVSCQETSSAYDRRSREDQEKVTFFLNKVVTKLPTEKESDNKQLKSEGTNLSVNTTQKSTVYSEDTNFQHIGYDTMMSGEKSTPSFLKNDNDACCSYTNVQVRCGDNDFSPMKFSNNRAMKRIREYPGSNQESNKRRCVSPKSTVKSCVDNQFQPISYGAINSKNMRISNKADNSEHQIDTVYRVTCNSKKPVLVQEEQQMEENYCGDKLNRKTLNTSTNLSKFTNTCADDGYFPSGNCNTLKYQVKTPSGHKMNSGPLHKLSDNCMNPEESANFSKTHFNNTLTPVKLDACDINKTDNEETCMFIEETKESPRCQGSLALTSCWIHSQDYGCPAGNIPSPKNCVFCQAVNRRKEMQFPFDITLAQYEKTCINSKMSNEQRRACLDMFAKSVLPHQDDVNDCNNKDEEFEKKTFERNMHDDNNTDTE